MKNIHSLHLSILSIYFYHLQGLYLTQQIQKLLTGDV